MPIEPRFAEEIADARSSDLPSGRSREFRLEEHQAALAAFTVGYGASLFEQFSAAGTAKTRQWEVTYFSNVERGILMEAVEPGIDVARKQNLVNLLGNDALYKLASKN